MRPATWPAECSLCESPPDHPCFYRYGTTVNHIPEVHAARISGEFGRWTERYDSLYRDRQLKFQPSPYRREAMNAPPAQDETREVDQETPQATEAAQESQRTQNSARQRVICHENGENKR